MHYEFFVLLITILFFFFLEVLMKMRMSCPLRQSLMRRLGMLKMRSHKAEMFLAPYLEFVS